jgi:hypothetical protein
VRALAKSIITTAAAAAGMAAAGVMDVPEKQSILLPMPRMELDYLPEDMARHYQRLTQFAHAADPDHYRMARFRLYQSDLRIRACVRSDDGDWLAAFVKAFIVALPRKIADADNNLVVVSVEQAVRGGFESKIVEAFKERSSALYLRFAGMICKDVAEGLITDVDVRSGITWNYQEA